MKPRVAVLTTIIGLLGVALLAPSLSQAKGVPVGEEFTMRIGDRVKVSGPKIIIDFVDVLSDSRCPVDVVCVWTGNAQIQLQLQSKGHPPKSVLLNTPQPPIQEEFKHYVVKLVKLDPPKISNHQIDKSDYVVTLIVVPAESQG